MAAMLLFQYRGSRFLSSLHVGFDADFFDFLADLLEPAVELLFFDTSDDLFGGEIVFEDDGIRVHPIENFGQILDLYLYFHSAD